MFYGQGIPRVHWYMYTEAKMKMYTEAKVKYHHKLHKNYHTINQDNINYANCVRTLCD